MATTNLTYKMNLDIPSPIDASGNTTGLDINRSVQTVISVTIRRSFVGTFVNPSDNIALTAANLGSNPQFIYVSATKSITVAQTIAILGVVTFNTTQFLWTQPPASNNCTAMTVSALAAFLPCDVEIIIAGPV